MKKLFLICLIALGWNTRGTAQARANFGNDSIGPLNDTLRYFAYKQLYKLSPTTSLTVHPFYKFGVPFNANNAVTHVGSLFINKDAALQVYGLETRLYRPQLVTSTTNSGGVPFRLYLCNVLNGMPVLPAIDSVSGTINNSGTDFDPGSPTYTAYPYQRVGKYFGGTFANGPRLVTGDFAVLGKCVSVMYGDTVNFLHTAGLTATATSGTALQKFGEGLGVIRKGGAFYKTTNFIDPSFGPGTDYEFCFAPMVTFTLHVSQLKSPTMEGACEWEVFTNTNTSSPEYVNRQFNFDEFYRELKPFHPSAAINPPNFTPDSVLAWDLGDGAPPFYLPVGLDSIHLLYSTGICNRFFNGTMTGIYKQSAYNVNAMPISAVSDFTGSCVWCYNDTLPAGIHLKGSLAGLKIYPNPTSDKVQISGLENTNTIYVYNMIGELISKLVTQNEMVSIDLINYPQGSYLIRVNNTINKNKLVKIIRQ